MSSIMSKDWAVLHGAFLLSEKLCQPSPLSSVQKAEWSRVGRPVLEAVRDLCGPEDPNTVVWLQRLLCGLWLKLLCVEAGDDVETQWRDSPFFPLQSGLPQVNTVVLLELVRSTGSARTFTRLLSSLPLSQLCRELGRLGQHVKSSPITEQDVGLLLGVWRELWKGLGQQEAAGEDSIERLFARQCARLSSLSSLSSNVNPMAAKRMKLDPTEAPETPDVLRILLYTLKDIKDCISTTDLCLQALSVSLDALYTTYLIEQAVVLTTEEEMSILSKVVSIRGESNDKLSPERIHHAQRDICASNTPSQFGYSTMELGEALKVITDIAQFWLKRGLLRVCDSSNLSYSAFQLEQSVKRVLPALQKAQVPETITEIDTKGTEGNALPGLLESLTFPGIEVSAEVKSKVASIIISHRLDGYGSYALWLSGESSCDELWMVCVEKNRAAFQQPDTLLRLTSTLMTQLQDKNANVLQCRRLLKVIADIFSALSLPDKNRAMSAMLRLSSRGFFSSSAPSALTVGFEQELNMAFNCIIQSRGASQQGNLNTAVSLVARVAFQNPQAALRSCCQSAVFNKGAFSPMADILQQLPGLREQRDEEEGDEALNGSSLLYSCLQDIIRTKPLSANEKEQLVQFLGQLMRPVMALEGEEKIQSFLPPQEVINMFVLPNLSTVGERSLDPELSVKLLNTALSEAASSSPHWLMDCSPFPLLYVLAQLYSHTLRCWEQPAVGTVHWSMDSKEQLECVLIAVGQLVGAEVAADPNSWSRALFWLYNKMESLHWSVRFHLKPVWREHFKNEVPSALLTVCDLPEQDWSGLELPQYGQGTGLLAWMECCCVSDSLQSTMLSHLSLERQRPDHMAMFSKGLLVCVCQTLPWCSVSQWCRLLRGLKELIASGRLNVPFSLEYVDFLPLLDLRGFSCELRLSVLLLRVLQLLCGSSCSHWLCADGWAHVGRLYAQAVRDIMHSVRAKLPVPSSAAQASTDSNPSCTSIKSPQTSKDIKQAKSIFLEAEMDKDNETETVPGQEVLFVLSQLFCHIQHIQVMIPGGQSEPLFLCCLEVLSHYEAIMVAFPHSSSPLDSDNTRHFFSTITDNLTSQEMKAVLQHKISQLVSGDA